MLQKQNLGDWLGKLRDIFKMIYMFSLTLTVQEDAGKIILGDKNRWGNGILDSSK